MGNKKHGKKKDNKKSKDSFAAIDSIGGVITGAPSAVIGAIGTAAHTAVDAVGDVGEGTGKAVADTAKNTVGTAQAALETIQPGHLAAGKIGAAAAVNIEQQATAPELKDFLRRGNAQAKTWADRVAQVQQMIHGDTTE